jgi:hypothetical protein
VINALGIRTPEMGDRSIATELSYLTLQDLRSA